MAGVFFRAPASHAAVPPFGQEILSRSTSEYLSRGSRFLVYSNPVFTRVGPYYRISLTPRGTVTNPAFSLHGFGGDSLYCGFELRNVGNVADSVHVGSTLVPPSTIGLGGVVFFHDTNSDADLDIGEDDRSFLNLAPGEAVDLSTLLVLSSGGGGGVSFLDVRAEVGDDAVQHSEESVVHVITQAPPTNTLHFGPAGNPRALPRGEGSPDDVTRVPVGFGTRWIVFENDVLNDGNNADIIQIEPADTSGWPPGFDVVLEDSSGNRIQSSSLDPPAVMIGQLDIGETRRIRVRVAPRAESFYHVLDDSLAIRLRIRSLVDTARVNETTDRLVLAESFNGKAALSLEQTFKENQASFGDIVTLVVTVTNVTDSVRVDETVVHETVQPTLDFLSSPAFETDGDGIRWRVGSLDPGERREAVVKFAVNGRVSKGWTKVIGGARGTALARDVSAGPVVNLLKIENDVFADEGTVLGDIFVDANENGRRDDGEDGVPRVGVFLESGEYALTDSTGRFSIPRAFSGYRVVRIDESTLPADVVDTDALLTRTNAPLGTERLVHLIASGHAVVAFPLPPKMTTRERVSRQISCGETVSVRKRQYALYRWPSIPSSLFEVGKAYLKTGTLKQLDPILDFLGRNPGWMVFLEGHTDSVPIHTPAFQSNYELSVARAQAVMRYLTARGVPEERVVVRGYGETRPVGANATREGRAKNRRVDVSLVPPGTNVDDSAELRRIEAGPERIQAVSDTFLVSVTWEISTDAPHPLDIGLSLEVPKGLEELSTHVTCGGVEVLEDGGAYRISGFGKSRGVKCEVSFCAAETDTHRARGLRALIDVLTPLSPVSSFGLARAEGSMNPPAAPAIVLEPFGAEAKTGQTRYFPIISWEETVSPVSRNAGSSLARGDAREKPDGGEDAAGAGGKGADGAASVSDVGESTLFGLLEPADGSVVTKRDQIEVVARIPLGSKHSLLCNGGVLPEKQIGTREIHLRERFEEITYYGVKIGKGWNAISLRAEPVDGSPVLLDSLSVALSGKPTSIALSPERVILPADGRSSGTIRVELRDEIGHPTINGLLATIVEGDSLVADPDQNPGQPGLQIATEDGGFLVHLRPSSVTGKKSIAIESHGITGSCIVAYVPPQRPMFLSGIIQGKLGLFDASGEGDPLGLGDYSDGLELDGESRFIIQGTTYAGINLTARVDTKKRYEDPLLKTDNPETQYPIYGDASELHYAAPAQGGNYIALEKGQSFLRYGDFRSPLTEGEFLSYKRSSTGISGAITSGADGVNAFVTKTDFSTVRDEIPGDGTSGYYYLSRSPIVENSVDLVIEVRDRYQEEKVLEIRPLVEHRDFTVNYFNGAVLFKEPVPAFSGELNPVMIVAIYEAESSEEGDYLYGVRGDLSGTGRFRLGATALAKDGNDTDYVLYGADGTVSLGRLDLSGELARSEDDVAGDGSAYKLQLGAKNLMGEHSVYVRKVDGDFLNPSFTGSAHELYSRKAGFDSHLRLTSTLGIDSHGHRHRFENTGEEKDNIDLFGKYDGPRFMLGGGVRAARQVRDASEREGFLSMVGAGIKAGSHAELRTHWEMNHARETVDDYPDRLRSGLSVELFRRYKVVATHEYLSAHERPATHQLLAGVEARAGQNSTVYSKYAMNRTANDERLGTILGLKQTVSFGTNLRGALDVEGFRSFSNRDEDEYVALKTGLTRLVKGESLVEGRYEYRWQRSAGRHLFQLNGAKEVENGVAVLFKDALSISANEGRESSLRMEGRLAGVYRPVVTPLRTLLLLKMEYDKYSPVDPNAIVWTTVVSTDVNVFPQPDHELRLKLAFKRVEDYSLGVSATGRNYLVLTQYVYRFAANWDLDFWGRFLGRVDAGTRQTGVGVEIGRVVFDRLRIGAGYSVNGFEDRDMAEHDAWEKGFGLRVQLILSDWMFNGYEF